MYLYKSPPPRRFPFCDNSVSNGSAGRGVFQFAAATTTNRHPFFGLPNGGDAFRTTSPLPRYDLGTTDSCERDPFDIIRNGFGAILNRPQNYRELEEEEDDRSLLADTIEPPTFSPLGRTGPPEPLHQNKKLRWDHKVNLIGEKLINPMIHCCDKCTLPILTYGRMIPCKHVFCYDCAKKADKTCYRCNDKVQRLEQSNLGTVFMCTYGGSRQGKDSCRRTYLSQRDLQAHITHRHLKGAASAAAAAAAASQSSALSHGLPSQQQQQQMAALVASHPPPPQHLMVRDPRQHPPPVSQHPPPPLEVSRASVLQQPPQQQPQQQAPPPPPQKTLPPEYRDMPPPVMASQQPPPQQMVAPPRAYQSQQNPTVSRPNLITVQIQDDSHKRAAAAAAVAAVNAASTNMPPPSMPPPPPQYAPQQPPPHMSQPPPPQQSYPPPQAPAAPPMAYNPSQPPYTQGMPPPATYNASAPPPPPPPARPLPPQFVHQPPPQFAHPPPPQPPPRFATALPYEEQGHQPTFHWSGATNMPPPRPSTVLPPPRPITGPPPPSTPPGAMMQQRTCAEPQFPYYSQ
ncbi:hypothetical protein HPB51_006449 [Rhipicephalus microplus]|uniref:E3 ubiquitin-protein ligase Hakai n=1 Tax=Rhipicephalus microplus TaxID=6941 RepID=A0A9J6E7B9_RHIMP|nr:hypothetical protein HPB51_006449 [Rhipicephalus microplus]